MQKHFTAYPSISFIAPFVAFILMMAVSKSLSLDPAWEYPIRVVVAGTVLLVVAPRISWRPTRPIGSIAAGLLVFVLWIGPDLLSDTYRAHWLFQNSLTGTLDSSVDAANRGNYAFLTFRILGTAVLVPIIEELFWRGWLVRYLVRADFLRVPIGYLPAAAFWITAILFATEHGPFWDVGLLAGVAYNAWIIRTKSLADCILAHAVTNASLAIYVIRHDQWQYWL